MISSPKKQMSLKERYICQAFSQLKITAPRSLVPVSASLFIS